MASDAGVRADGPRNAAGDAGDRADERDAVGGAEERAEGRAGDERKRGSREIEQMNVMQSAERRNEQKAVLETTGRSGRCTASHSALLLAERVGL